MTKTLNKLRNKNKIKIFHKPEVSNDKTILLQNLQLFKQ